MQKDIGLPAPAAALQQFVREHVGRIEAHRHHPAELRWLITRLN